jgi:general secretion pathway protein E
MAGHIDYSLTMLVELMLRAGVLSGEQARKAIEQEGAARARLLKAQVASVDARRQNRVRVSPAQVLASFEFVGANGRVVDEDVVMQHIAQAAGLPFEKPDPLKLNAEVIAQTMTRPFARHNNCVPLRKQDGHVVIAIDNPFDQQLIEQLRLLLQTDIKLVVSSRSDIQRIITEVYGFRSSISAAAEQVHKDRAAGINNLEQLTRLTGVDKLEATDRPIIAAVEYLLHYAFDQRASDIHIEPKREQTHVRLRIDGLLHTIYTLPSAVHPPFVSRLKMLARMDIAEKRRPQDGRIKTERDGREVELRVSSLPVAFGEKIVIRIFDPQTLIQDLEQIGFYKDDLALWRSFSHRPHGMVLVTGPTGSGKTTTLYSTLKELSGPDVNITTVEDPIEMVYEEFNQVLVQRKIDVTFSTALRTILRQDPDIIMVGEIRDNDTATMAVQAAMTGHMVFSTLHTNDTPSTITRLLDLGVEPFLLSTTLVGVMAQRLLRKICPHCKVKTTLTQEQIELLEIKVQPHQRAALPVFYGEGCLSCRGTGYYGRTAVFELMAIDDSIRRLINERAGAPDIRRAARANNMVSLRECAIKKMAQGITTFEEVITVVSES